MPRPAPPCNKGRKIIKVNALMMAQLMKHLLEGDYTCQELAEETGLHYVTVLHYTREMYREGVLHICKWDKRPESKDPIRIYKLGSKPDAKKKIMTDVEKSQRYRQKKKQLKLVQMMAGDSTLFTRKPKAQQTQQKEAA